MGNPFTLRDPEVELIDTLLKGLTRGADLKHLARTEAFRTLSIKINNNVRKRNQEVIDMSKLNSGMVDNALAATKGNKKKAAEQLGVAPSTLRRFLARTSAAKTQPGTPVPAITEAAETSEAQPA